MGVLKHKCNGQQVEYKNFSSVYKKTPQTCKHLKDAVNPETDMRNCFDCQSLVQSDCGRQS